MAITARALALLEGKPAAKELEKPEKKPETAQRFVVRVLNATRSERLREHIAIELRVTP